MVSWSVACLFGLRPALRCAAHCTALHCTAAAAASPVSMRASDATAASPARHKTERGCESGAARCCCCTRAAVVVVDVGVPSERLMRPSPHPLACCIPLCHSDPSRSTIFAGGCRPFFRRKMHQQRTRGGPLSHHVDRLHAKVGGPPAHPRRTNRTGDGPSYPYSSDELYVRFAAAKAGRIVSGGGAEASLVDARPCYSGPHNKAIVQW